MAKKWPTRDALFDQGIELMNRFCAHNNVKRPDVVKWHWSEWRFSVCAYYRRSTINIELSRCANVGLAGRNWSYPGYSVDRTPYGVIQHELGHHIDTIFSTVKGPYYGDFSQGVLASAREEPLTGYCPNTAEWFAEMFRLFVTNPDLLAHIRPKTFEAIIKRGQLDPVFPDTWEHRLEGAPTRTIEAARKKVDSAKRKSK